MPASASSASSAGESPAPSVQVLLALVLFLLVLVEVIDDPALEAGAVEHREVELLVGGAQLDEEVEGLVEGAGRIGVGPVGLVDDDDRPQAEAQGPHEHVARLGHRAFVGVDEQQHRVDHAEHTLDLAAEIGVTGRVDDVDQVVLPLHRAVLGADGDAALALEVVAVHDALVDVRVLAEHVRGAEDAVDQRGLAMIDVGDDRQVADLVDGVHRRSQPLGVVVAAPGERRAGLTVYTLRARRARAARCRELAAYRVSARDAPAGGSAGAASDDPSAARPATSTSMKMRFTSG